MNKEWLKCSLGKVISIKHGFAFKGEYFAPKGKYIILTPGNFYEQGGFRITPGKEKYYIGQFPTEYICSKDDLIVAMTEQAEGLLGSTALVPTNDTFLHNQRIGLISIDKKAVDKNFLNYLFRTKNVRNQIRDSASGSKVKHTSPSKISNVQVELPPIGDQKNIGYSLSILDTKIELNTKICSELEALSHDLYHYWFSQFDFPDEKGKPYRNSGGKMVWNEELGREIPKGWRVGSLLDIAKFTNGVPCQKYRPVGNDKIPVIKIKEIRKGIGNESEYVRPDIPASALVHDGDLLFSWSASLEVQIWAGGTGALNQHIFKVTSDAYCRSFILFQLLGYLLQFRMLADNRKTTMGHITQDHLEQSRVVIPPKPIVDMLDTIIAPFFDELVLLRRESLELARLRDFLLPLLMNGQVKVSE
jgi:type I restriction enzyme, S subunit